MLGPRTEHISFQSQSLRPTISASFETWWKKMSETKQLKAAAVLALNNINVSSYANGLFTGLSRAHSASIRACLSLLFHNDGFGYFQRNIFCCRNYAMELSLFIKT